MGKLEVKRRKEGKLRKEGKANGKGEGEVEGEPKKANTKAKQFVVRNSWDSAILWGRLGSVSIRLNMIITFQEHHHQLRMTSSKNFKEPSCLFLESSMQPRSMSDHGHLPVHINLFIQDLVEKGVCP